MQKYVTEVIGTFFLVFTIGMCVVGRFPMAPLAIGSALMVMVYMGGHISGAHYNPAVTLALFLRGKMEKKDLVPYWISQLAGAILAALMVWVIRGDTFAPGAGEIAKPLAAVLNEALYTFALALVVLNVACTKATEGNSYYGLAIGFTIAVAVAAGETVSGGAYNPAVGVGPAIVHMLNGGEGIKNIWIYLVGPFGGGVAGAYVYAFQHGES